MMTSWLTITSLLWILRYGDAMECRQHEKICYVNYNIQGICKEGCYNLTKFSFVNVPDSVLRKVILQPIDMFTILDLDVVGNISSILDAMEPPLDTLKSISIIGSDLDVLYISSTSVNTLTIMDTKISVIILKQQNYIKKIQISRNLLKAFSYEHLRSLPKAEILDLSTNEISIFGKIFEAKVSGPEFVLNPSLKYLNLSNNQLVHLYGETFLAMPYLKILDLSYNIIGRLQNAPFTSMKTSLIELYLSYNRISHITVDSFHHLFSLNVLYLDHNNISFLEKKLFTDLANLIILDLSFNRLGNIPPEVILPLTQLTQLNLEANQIVEFDFQILFDHLLPITSLHLKDNPLSCESLKDKFIPNSAKFFSQGVCSDNSYNGICCIEEAQIKTAAVPNLVTEIIQFTELSADFSDWQFEFYIYYIMSVPLMVVFFSGNTLLYVIVMIYYWEYI